MEFMSGDLLHMCICKFIMKKKVQNLACQRVFAFGKLEIFVRYFFTNSEHTIENADKLSQLNMCIYSSELTGRSLSLDSLDIL